MAVLITGTGTGPFNIAGSGVTDPVTSAAIYAYVIAQNAANASRIGTTIFSYSWACKFTLTSCLWNPVQEAHIFAQTPTIGASAEFRNGSLVSGVAKNGGMIQMPTTGGLLTGGGKFASYGGVVAAPLSSPGASNGPVVLRDTVCQFADSITNSGTNDYFRVTIGSSGAVGFKVTVIPIRFQDVKFAGCTIAFQHNTTSPFTPVDTILEQVTYDIVDNLTVNTLTLQGLYSDFGVPKNTLVITGERAGGIKIIQWRYNLAVSSASGLLSGAAVTICDVLGVVTYSGATASGVIPQQTLERVRYTGLVNRAYLTPWAGTITNKYPHTVRVRKFGFLPVEIVKQADQHSADGVILAADTGATGTEAAAAMITGVSIDPVTQTVTVSEVRPVPEIYNAIAYFLALAANHGVPWFALCSGSTVRTDAWSWVLTVPVTGTVASSAGVIAALAACVSAVVLTGTARWDTQAPCVAQGGSAASGTTVRVTAATSGAVSDFSAFEFDAGSIFENNSGQSITLQLTPGQTVPTLLATAGTIIVDASIDAVITAPHLLPGTTVRLYDKTNNVLLDESVTTVTGYSFAKGWTANALLELRHAKLGYMPRVSLGAFTSAGATFLDVQSANAVYDANGIDGATLAAAEFATDFVQVQIDIADSDKATTFQRLYAWYCYVETTFSGLQYFAGGLSAVDTVNYMVNVNVVDLKLDNVLRTPTLLTGGSMTRSDGTSIIADTSGSIQIDPAKAYVANSSGLMVAIVAKPSLAQIEGSAVLAKESTVQTVLGLSV
jgi:hypothetical protein